MLWNMGKDQARELTSECLYLCQQQVVVAGIQGLRNCYGETLKLNAFTN